MIQSLHFTAKQELNDYVSEMVNKLTHLFDKIVSADVCLKLENFQAEENKVCEIRLSVPGNDLFVKKEGKTFEGATSEAVSALQQQLKKMKEKFNIF